MPAPVAKLLTNLQQLPSTCDALVLVGNNAKSSFFEATATAVAQHAKLDARVMHSPTLIGFEGAPGERLLYVPITDLARDYDDARRFYDAARDLAQVLVSAGVRHPVFEVCIEGLTSEVLAKYKYALELVFLGLCQGLWQPLEARQALDENEIEPIQAVTLLSSLDIDVTKLNAIEAGKRVARDLCGTEPERMAPQGFAQYCQEALAGSAVKVSVIDDEQQILKDYPLLHAVARASIEVKRHQPRIIRMEYQGEGEIERTLMFAGKGITFDTGGADLKVNGHMAGMSRDKGGAAAVAGFMKSLSMIQPKGIKVIAEIGAVRNSIGAEAFIPDEIITSHAGVRVRVGNTDAEGRMLLADLLSHLREQAVHEVNPSLFSVATLTGHAAIAFGPYTALVENQTARNQQVSKELCEVGELWGDPLEPSLSRREDFDFVQPRTKADDVLSSNNAPSVTTVRGHQFPMAFLSIASGLQNHQAHSNQPLAYTHVDIAGSGVEQLDWQHGKPTAAPVTSFVNCYL